MPDTPLQQLSAHGQSVWIDYLSRPFVQDGDLEALVREGVDGVTSNPTIFQAAIAEGDAYDDQLREVLHDARATRRRSSSRWRVDDIRGACDILRAEWDETGENARDGWVSLEVDPNLAHDTDGDDRRGQAPARARRPPEPLHQDPGDAGGPARDRGDDRRRHPGQRHADLLARAPPRGRRGLHPRPPAPGRRRRRPRARWPRWRRSSSRASTPRPTSASTRSAATTSSRARSRSPTPSSPTRPTRRSSPSEQWEALAAKGATRAALPVGVDVDEEPRLPRRALRRGADRPATRSTRCRARRSRRSRTTATSRRHADSRTSRARAARSTRSPTAGIDYDDVVETLEREGVEKFAKSLRAAVRGHRGQARPAGGGMSDAERHARARPAAARRLRPRPAPRPAPGHPTSSMSAADLMAVLLDGGYLRLDTGDLDDPRQRPPDLLQGPRLAAVLLGAQGGGDRSTTTSC